MLQIPQKLTNFQKVCLIFYQDNIPNHSYDFYSNNGNKKRNPYLKTTQKSDEIFDTQKFCSQNFVGSYLRKYLSHKNDSITNKKFGQLSFKRHNKQLSRGKTKLEQLPCEQFLQAFEFYRAFLRAKQVGE